MSSILRSKYFALKLELIFYLFYNKSTYCSVMSLFKMNDYNTFIMINIFIYLTELFCCKLVEESKRIV